MTICGRLVLGALAAMLAFSLTGATAIAGETSTAMDGIALSNSYAANSWRQTMLRMWSISANRAIAGGVIARTTVTNADNSTAEQVTQIEGLIKAGWNAIAIDAASPTALNDVIHQACNAHIVIVVFDGLATAPCAYKIELVYEKMGLLEAWYVANNLHVTNTVLEVRGIAGTVVDAQIHEGIVKELSNYPNIVLIGSVYGNWTDSDARQAVARILPSLPNVDAVVTQGGDAYGVYEAFAAARRRPPVIIMGNRQDELALWKKLSKAPGGYATFSISPAPGVSSIAFWVAQQVLARAKVPKTIIVPWLVITEDDLDGWLKVVPPGGVASPIYSGQWTKQLIAATLGHAEFPEMPDPKELP
jgi:ribose transport system substrate-binding protein